MSEALARAMSGRVYYGWVIVAVLMIAGFTQVGEYNPALAVFMEPLQREFGWSRGQVSLAIALGTLVGGLLGPGIGVLLDRYGSRVILVVCQVVYGTSLIALTFTPDSLLYFVLVYAVGRAAVVGGTGLAAQVAIANWFIRKRGRAMGVLRMTDRITQGIVPAVAAFIVTTLGWRNGWLALGLSAFIFAITPTVLLLRRRPEDIGLLPDGDPRFTAENAKDAERNAETKENSGTSAPPPAVSAPSTVNRTSAVSPGSTLREAARTRGFWLLLMAGCASTFVAPGLNLHLLPYFLDTGLSLPEAVGMLGLFYGAAAAGALIGGALLDRFPLRYVLAGHYVVCGAGLLLLVTVQGAWVAAVYAVAYGAGFGGTATISSVKWAVYFGRSHVGSIAGAAHAVQLVLGSVSPVFGGWFFDREGNYATVFTAWAASMLLGAVFAMAAGRPVGDEGMKR